MVRDNFCWFYPRGWKLENALVFRFFLPWSPYFFGSIPILVGWMPILVHSIRANYHVSLTWNLQPAMGMIPAIEFPWFQVGSRCHRSLLNLPRFYPPRGHSTQPGLFWCWTKISSQIGPRVGEGRSLWRNFWIYGDLKMYPLVMTNSLPWKDPPFLIGKPSINGLFSMAMFNNQMVHLESSRYHNWEFYWDCTGKMILGKTDREWICKQHLEF